MLLQGAWEKDELRKDDSFVTFEEVFQLAQQQNVRCAPPRTAPAATMEATNVHLGSYCTHCSSQGLPLKDTWQRPQCSGCCLALKRPLKGTSGHCLRLQTSAFTTLTLQRGGSCRRTLGEAA